MNTEQTKREEVIQDIYKKLMQYGNVVSANHSDEVVDAFDTRYYVDFDNEGIVTDISFEKIPTE